VQSTRERTDPVLKTGRIFLKRRVRFDAPDQLLDVLLLDLRMRNGSFHDRTNQGRAIAFQRRQEIAITFRRPIRTSVKAIALQAYSEIAAGKLADRDGAGVMPCKVSAQRPRDWRGILDASRYRFTRAPSRRPAFAGARKRLNATVDVATLRAKCGPREPRSSFRIDVYRCFAAASSNAASLLPSWFMLIAESTNRPF